MQCAAPPRLESPLLEFLKVEVQAQGLLSGPGAILCSTVTPKGSASRQLEPEQEGARRRQQYLWSGQAVALARECASSGTPAQPAQGPRAQGPLERGKQGCPRSLGSAWEGVPGRATSAPGDRSEPVPSLPSKGPGRSSHPGVLSSMACGNLPALASHQSAPSSGGENRSRCNL